MDDDANRETRNHERRYEFPPVGGSKNNTRHTSFQQTGIDIIKKEYELIENICLFMKKSKDSTHSAYDKSEIVLYLKEKVRSKYLFIPVLFLQALIALMAGEAPFRRPNEGVETHWFTLVLVGMVILIVAGTVISQWFYVESLKPYFSFLPSERQIVIRYFIPLYNMVWIAISAAILILCLTILYGDIFRKKDVVNATVLNLLCILLFVFQYAWIACTAHVIFALMMRLIGRGITRFSILRSPVATMASVRLLRLIFR